MAATIIAKNPEAYRFTQKHEPFKYDEIVSKKARISVWLPAAPAARTTKSRH
jgi:hypothetical protein